jgi:hypothetical protein
MTTTVIKIGTAPYDVYIGRRGKGHDGYFGNLHECDKWCRICGKYHDREDCIRAFSVDFYKRLKADPEYRRAVLALKGKTLGCFCHPLPCHGNVIANWVNRQ